jgi:hypothetical protein
MDKKNLGLPDQPVGECSGKYEPVVKAKWVTPALVLLDHEETDGKTYVFIRERHTTISGYNSAPS